MNLAEFMQWTNLVFIPVLIYIIKLETRLVRLETRLEILLTRLEEGSFTWQPERNARARNPSAASAQAAS